MDKLKITLDDDLIKIVNKKFTSQILNDQINSEQFNIMMFFFQSHQSFRDDIMVHQIDQIAAHFMNLNESTVKNYFTYPINVRLIFGCFAKLGYQNNNLYHSLLIKYFESVYYVINNASEVKGKFFAFAKNEIKWILSYCASVNFKDEKMFQKAVSVLIEDKYNINDEEESKLFEYCHESLFFLSLLNYRDDRLLDYTWKIGFKLFNQTTASFPQSEKIMFLFWSFAKLNYVNEDIRKVGKECLLNSHNVNLKLKRLMDFDYPYLKGIILPPSLVDDISKSYFVDVDIVNNNNVNNKEKFGKEINLIDRKVIENVKKVEIDDDDDDDFGIDFKVDGKRNSNNQSKKK